MRKDAIGLFWEDIPEVKEKKVKEKIEPPKPVWLEPDYLPDIGALRKKPIHYFTDQELIERAGKEALIWDIESYPNYFCCAFKSRESGLVIVFEKLNGQPWDAETQNKFLWVLMNYKVVGFNSFSFDRVVASMACRYEPREIATATNELISYGMRDREVAKIHKFKLLKIPNHIDIMEVAPLSASLKIYSGRIFSHTMQDLPFQPGTELNEAQREVTRLYCINDLDNTGDLYDALTDDLQLRELMGERYGIDLRSKSDAQIAEAVLTKQLKKYHKFINRPNVEPGTRFFYQPPSFLQFQTPLMQRTLAHITNLPFEVSEGGKIVDPPEMKKLTVTLGQMTYTMGIGGLHSTEEKRAIFNQKHSKLKDFDVASYYPFIKINCGYYPKHLGPPYLDEYESIVYERLGYKAEGKKDPIKKKWAGGLKIVVNGSFGKLGSKYSKLYDPNLMFHVTLGGQLSILMLIEAMELSGIPVVSGNTDGIVVNCPDDKTEVCYQITHWWQRVTQFELEETRYSAMYSANVNNYLAVKEGAESISDIKRKGWYEKAGLTKNPTNEICSEAILQYLLDGTPFEETITNCTDFKKFISVRAVKGGGVYVEGNDVTYLGKAVRWYYKKDCRGQMVYAKSGNKVATSDGGHPCMVLPEKIPEDIDYDRYLERTIELFEAAGGVYP